ncbi:MAG TPA: hypothetical protein VM532_04120 [Burkholderiales bacterium]|nr:hypothetical protein [Burkholderiales bacterium]
MTAMRVAITAIGMISSVGHDVATCCASIRAGIQRPNEISHFSLLDADEQESKPLTGRPIQGFTDGFAGAGLWRRMATACLQNLVADGGLPPVTDAAFWSRTALIAIAPNPDSGRFEDYEDVPGQMFGGVLITGVLRELGWMIPSSAVTTIPLGHAGAIEAIKLAFGKIANGEVHRVIVVGADSYLDPVTLDWLDGADRLKADDNPFGLTPGEAGACFMIESESAAQNRNAIVQAYMMAPATALGASPLTPGGAVLGDTLAIVLKETLSGAGLALFSGVTIADLNGEPWRAQQLGAARVLVGQLLNDTQFLFPCDSLGDVGSATGATSICVATRAIKRGYAPNGQALVVCSSEEGHVGSVLVRQA